MAEINVEKLVEREKRKIAKKAAAIAACAGVAKLCVEAIEAHKGNCCCDFGHVTIGYKDLTGPWRPDIDKLDSEAKGYRVSIECGREQASHILADFKKLEAEGGIPYRLWVCLGSGGDGRWHRSGQFGTGEDAGWVPPAVVKLQPWPTEEAGSNSITNVCTFNKQLIRAFSPLEPAKRDYIWNEWVAPGVRVTLSIRSGELPLTLLIYRAERPEVRELAEKIVADLPRKWDEKALADLKVLAR